MQHAKSGPCAPSDEMRPSPGTVNKTPHSLAEGWGYRRTVGRNKIVGRSDWASMASSGKHPCTDTPSVKA